MPKPKPKPKPNANNIFYAMRHLTHEMQDEQREGRRHNSYAACDGIRNSTQEAKEIVAKQKH